MRGVERVNRTAFTRTWRATAALLVAGALVATGCSKNKGGSGGTIYIAVAGPMTGDYAQYGGYMKQAAQIAVNKINGAGGIKGQKVQLLSFDDQLDPKQAASVAQKICLDKRIVAVVGHFASSSSLAAVPIYDRCGIV